MDNIALPEVDQDASATVSQAGVGIRLAARAIDAVIVIGILFLVLVVAMRFTMVALADEGYENDLLDINENQLVAKIALQVIAILAVILYETLCLRFGGATWGKKAVQLRVLPLQQGRVGLTMLQSAARAVLVCGALILLPPAGYSWVVFLLLAWFVATFGAGLLRPNRRCLHDRIMGTVVVDAPSTTKVSGGRGVA